MYAVPMSLKEKKKMSTIISIILRIGKVASVFDLFEFSQASKQILLPIWPEKEKKRVLGILRREIQKGQRY